MNTMSGKKNEIIPGFYKAYSPDELANHQEDFTSYSVEMDKGNYKEIYEYEYENDSLLYDEKNNKYIAKTSIEPILYMGDQPVVFRNMQSNEKYYYDPNSGSLVSYDDSNNKKAVPELINSIDYKNPLNVKEKLFDKRADCNTNTNSFDDEEIQEEEEEIIEKPKPKNISESVKQVMNKLDTTGFSKSFILSLIHELGSKELKVKFIEDERDDLTDNDFDKLNELVNHTHAPNHKHNNNNNDTNNDNDTNNNNDNDKIIEEEESESEIEPENKIYTNYSPVTTTTTTTTKPPCPKIENIQCPNGSKVVYDANNCPKIECIRKIKYVSIDSYDIPLNTKIILYIVSISIIVGFFVLLFNKNFVRF